MIQGSQASPATDEYFMVDGQVVSTPVTLVTGSTSVSGNSTPAVTVVISTPGVHAISLLSNGTSSIFLNGNVTITAVTPPASSASTVSVAANSIRRSPARASRSRPPWAR